MTGCALRLRRRPQRGCRGFVGEGWTRHWGSSKTSCNRLPMMCAGRAAHRELGDGSPTTLVWENALASTERRLEENEFQNEAEC
jgi:hypothetical protein